MKKIIIMLLAVGFLGMAIPTMPVYAGNNIKVNVIEGSQLKKAAKVSKKSNSSKKSDTKKRLKKLNQLGIGNPKTYLNYGKDLSLREMGGIIGAWIIDVWVNTGQLPSTITSNPPDWLMVNINGTCYSGSGTCSRWS
jgi:hypothetical protein